MTYPVENNNHNKREEGHPLRLTRFSTQVKRFFPSACLCLSLFFFCLFFFSFKQCCLCIIAIQFAHPFFFSPVFPATVSECVICQDTKDSCCFSRSTTNSFFFFYWLLFSFRCISLLPASLEARVSCLFSIY